MGERRLDDEQRRLLLNAAAKLGVFVLAIGILVAICTLVLVKALGLDDGGDKRASSETKPPSPLPSQALDTPSSAKSSATPAASTKIALSGPSVAGSMQRINLTGTYAGHSSGVLQVQRLEGSQWEDFAGVSATVGNGGAFKTYVQTGHTGANTFRVFDESAKLASNKVTVNVG